MEQNESEVTATLLDKVTQQQYKVAAAYLFGADGARSSIVSQLGLPLKQNPSGGRALNILVRADLSHLVPHRGADLNWVIQPDSERPDFGFACCWRVVKPWNEWLLAFLPAPGSDFVLRPNKDDYLEQVQKVIGDDTPVEILQVSTWKINDTYAEKYSDGRV